MCGDFTLDLRDVVYQEWLALPVADNEDPSGFRLSQTETRAVDLAVELFGITKACAELKNVFGIVGEQYHPPIVVAKLGEDVHHLSQHGINVLGRAQHVAYLLAHQSVVVDFLEILKPPVGSRAQMVDHGIKLYLQEALLEMRKRQDDDRRYKGALQDHQVVDEEPGDRPPDDRQGKNNKPHQTDYGGFRFAP